MMPAFAVIRMLVTISKAFWAPLKNRASIDEWCFILSLPGLIARYISPGVESGFFA